MIKSRTSARITLPSCPICKRENVKAEIISEVNQDARTLTLKALPYCCYDYESCSGDKIVEKLNVLFHKLNNGK